MRSCSRPGVLAAFLCGGLLGACGPAKYPVNLSPPYKAGQKFRLVADSSQDIQLEATITAKGSVASEIKKQEAHVALHFEGGGAVLAIFPNGNVQKVSVAATALTATKNGQPLAGMPALGANIAVEWLAQGLSVTADGKTVDTEAARVLVEALNLGDLFGFAKATQTDQQTFGPSTPVAVGGTWPVNSDAMKNTLQAALETDMGGVKGTMTLDSLTGEGDNRVINVSGNLSATDINPKLPADVKLDSATLEAALSEQIPATTGQGTLKQSVRILLLEHERADSEAVKIKMDVRSEVKNSRIVTFH